MILVNRWKEYQNELKTHTDIIVVHINHMQEKQKGDKYIVIAWRGGSIKKSISPFHGREQEEPARKKPEITSVIRYTFRW